MTSSSTRTAVDYFNDKMKYNAASDYTISAVSETPIIEVFHLEIDNTSKATN